MELDTKGNQTWNKLIEDGKVLGKLQKRLKIDNEEYKFKKSMESKTFARTSARRYRIVDMKER
jgi:hypothetical protein